MPGLIRTFKIFPLELFRGSHGRVTKLRPWNPKSKQYDIVTQNGCVTAKALDPMTYRAPNGAVMRPNSPYHRKIIQGFQASNVVVYSVPAGTRLPDDLILVHEVRDQYSVQPAKNMYLQELNEKITLFLETHGQVKTKDNWLQSYPSVVYSHEMFAKSKR